MDSNWLFGVGLDTATAWTEFALTWLVQSAVILTLGLLAAGVLRRRNPAMRSVVYQTTLVAVLAAPLAAYALSSAGLTFLSLALPPARYEVEEIVEPPAVVVAPETTPAAPVEPDAPAAQLDTSLETSLGEELQPSPDGESEELAAKFSGDFPSPAASLAPLNSPQPQAAATPAAPSVPPAPAEPIVRRVVRTSMLLAAVWLAIPVVWVVGSVLFCARLCLDHLRLNVLRRSASPVDAATRSTAAQLAWQLEVPLPELLRSPLVASPCLCGIRRPAILLPEEIDREALPAVMVHELAHRKRGDLVWNLLRHVAVGLLWPQPLVWILSRRLESVAEDVCDDYVLAYGGCRQTYASTLVAIAQRDLVPSEAAVSLVTFRSMLGQRVQRVLDSSRRLSLTVGLAALVMIVAGGASAALVAGLLGPNRQAAATVVDDENNHEGQEASNKKPAVNEQTDDEATESQNADNDVVTVRGVVLDPQGKPAAGARVIAVGYERQTDVPWTDSMPPVIAETQSQADGSYEIAFRKSQCEKNVDGMDTWHFTTIAAFHPNHAPALNDYNFFDNPQAATLQLVADQPVHGRIVDLEGQPIAGATVQLRGLGRNDKEDLSRWIAAMRDGVSYFNSEKFDRPHHASRTLRFLSPEPVTTDAEGRFTLQGLGQNRYAILRLNGPGIALADLHVVTMPIENLTVEMGHADFKHPIIYYGSNFQFAAPPEQAISGVVRDADTKQPIAGARIILDKLAGTRLSGIRATETITDANGRYELQGMPHGKGNQLLVIPSDDQPYFMREFDDVPITEDFSPVTFDMELQHGIWITGRVTEQASGEPLEARMHYLPWPDNPHIQGREQWHDGHLHGPQAQYLTDHEGRYRLVGLPGRGIVTAWCVESPFPQGQGVREISDLPNRDVYREIVGVFAPTEQSPTIVKEVRPADDAKEIEVDIAVHAGESLDVRFVDTAGRPVENLKIQGLYPKATRNRGAPHKDGAELRVLGLRPNEERLLIVHYEAAQLGKVLHVALADAQDGRMTIPLAPTTTVVGRLLNGAGDPLNSAKIEARPSTEGDYALTLPPIYSDAIGHFSLTLLPGCQYNISVDEPGIGLKSIAAELAVSPGETIDLGTIDVTSDERPEPKRTAMAAAGRNARATTTTSNSDDELITVRGVVLDPEGKPHPGAMVLVKAPGKLDFVAARTTSDHEGRFVLSFAKSQAGQSAGDWKSNLLVAAAEHLAPDWVCLGEVGEIRSVTLSLRQDVAIYGRIVDLEHRPVVGATLDVRTLRRSKTNTIAPWLDSLRGGAVYSRKHPNMVDTWLGMRTDGIRMTAKTDAEGRFRIAGVGPDSLAEVQLTGGGAATSDLRIVTVPGEPIVTRFGNPEPFFEHDVTIYGPGFEHLAEPSQPIVGRVVDAATGQPLAGIRVSAKNFAGKRAHEWDPVIAQSDENGNYRLDGMPRGEGNKVLVYPAPGQPYFPRHLDVPIGSGLEATQLDIALQPGTFIRGRITNKTTGRPVATEVRYAPWIDNPAIESTGYKSLFQQEVLSKTDEDGRFAVVGLPGAGLLMIDCRSEYLPAGQGLDQLGDTPGAAFLAKFGGISIDASSPTAVHKVVVPEGARELAADIQLDAGEKVTLQAVDPSGTPVNGLTVKGIGPVSNPGLEKDLPATFAIEAIKPGEKRWVQIESPDHKLGRILQVSLPVDKRPMRVELQPTSTVTARLLDSNSDPIRDDHVSVSLPHRDSWAFSVTDARTDSDGRMQIDALPPGPAYDIRIASVGLNWEPVAESLAVGPGETIDLGTIDVTSDERPEPKRTAMAAAAPEAAAEASQAAAAEANKLESEGPLVIRGVVLDPEGKPAKGVTVKAYRDSSTSMWAKNVPKMETTSDADGRYTIEVPQVLSNGYRSGKPWPLSVLLAKADGVADTHLRLNDEKAAADATIRMTPYVPLEGRIVNLEGHPVAGVKIELHQVNVTDGGNLEPYLTALRDGKSSSEIEADIKPNMILGDDELRKASITVTNADGRFRLERVARHGIALLRLSGAGIVLQEVDVANASSEPIPFGDNSHNGDTPFLYGLPFEYAVEPAPPIVGVVRDADTAQPISGATIYCTTYELINQHGFQILQAKTGDDGRYRLDGVRPKQAGGTLQRFVVRSEGDKPYLPLEFSAPEATDGLAPITHDIELHRGIWIEGRVTDAENGAPVRAKVVYLPWHSNPRVEKLPEYQNRALMGVQALVRPNTDDEGRFKLIGIPGRGLLEVLETEETRYPVGQGFDKVAGLLGSAEKFENISQLYAPRPEWMIAVQELNIEDDAERAMQDISLRPGKSVTLKLRDGDGKPVALSQAIGLESGTVVRTRFEPGDTVEVAGLEPNERRPVLLMNVQRKLGAMLEIALAEDPARERMITLAPLARITGRVLDADGQPLARQARDRDPISLWTTLHDRHVRTHSTSPGREGRFELLAIPGPSVYRVAAAGVRTNLAENLRVEPGETIDLGTIDGTSTERPPIQRTPMKLATHDTRRGVVAIKQAALHSGDTLTFAGTVVSPEGKPVAGAKLHVIYYTPKYVETKPRATSGADGTFRFSMNKSDFESGEAGLPWEGGAVVATAEGYGPAWVALAGAEVTGEIRRNLEAKPNYDPKLAALDPTIRLVADDVPIEGRLLTLEGQPISGARVHLIELHASRHNSLDAWIDAVENKQADYYQARDHVPNGFGGLHLQQQVAQLFPPVETDREGRFRLRGAGRERIVMLQIEGQGMETQQVHVLTRPGKTYAPLRTARDPDLGTIAYHGSTFELAVGPSRDVVGTVRDEQTGQPIAGLTVASDKLAGQAISGAFHRYVNTTTDAEGKYRLRGLPVGENRIIALPQQSEPHLAVSREVEVSLEAEPTVDFTLPRGIWIRGRVTDAKTGEPLRAWVEYFAFYDNPARKKLDGRQETRVTTDLDGRFAVRGVPGQGIVGVTAMFGEQYPRGVGADKITHGRENDGGINFRDNETVAFRTEPSLCVSTAFHQLKEISPGSDAEPFVIDFALEPGPSLTGIVLDPEGRPLAGAMYADGGVYGTFRPPGLKTHVFTVQNFVPNQPRRISFYHVERKLAGSKLLTGDELAPIEVKLQPWSTVTGRVLLQNGEPAENALLYGTDFNLLRPKGSLLGVIPDRPPLKTDGEGRFRVDMLAADTPYALSASQGRMTLGTVSSGFTVAAGETKDLGDLTIQPPKPALAEKPTAGKPAPLPADAAKTATPSDSLTFTGTVLGPDGKPHAGAKVMLPYRTGEVRKVAEAVSAADGSFRIDVPRAEFPFTRNLYTQLAATAEGFGLAWNAAAPFEESGEMLRRNPQHNRADEYAALAKTRTLELVADRPITGQVVNLEGQPVANAQIRVRYFSEKRGEGIAAWLEAMQSGATDLNEAWRHLSDTFGALGFAGDPTSSILTAVADAEGRFRLTGTGRDRLAHLIISGPGIESREVLVRTQPGSILSVPEEVTDPTGKMTTIYPAEFQYAAAPSYPVVGTVRDIDTGEPLAGVEITPEEIAGINLIGRAYPWIRTVSDALGHYRLEGLPIGENLIAAVPAPGMPYPLVVGTAEIDPTRPETKLDLQLKRGVRIRGRVVDQATGEPVVASVEYLPFSDNQRVKEVPGLLRSTKWERVDENGDFSLVGIPGHGLLAVLALGNNEKYPRGGGLEKIAGAAMREHLRTYPTLTSPVNTSYLVELNIDESATEVQQNVELSAGRTRVGTVLDAEGQPLAGAGVSGLTNGEFWEKLKTNEFTVRHLNTDEVRRLTFYHEERNLSGSVEVRGDDESPLVVTLQPAGTLSGRLRFESGDVASRINLWAENPRGQKLSGIHPGGQYELTDTEGHFTIRGLVPGHTYSLEALRASHVLGYAAKDVTVAAGETKDLGELTIPNPQK